MIACLRPLSALILAGLLTACATSSNSGLGELPRTPNASIEQLLQQASQSKPEEAALLRLSAADLAYQQKDLARSSAILGQIPLETLKPAQQVFASTLGAELALARNKPKAALQALQHPSMQHLGELPVTQQVRTQRAKAQALAADGQVLAAAKERIYFAPLLEGPAVLENQEKIWSLVSSLPVDQLQPSASEGDLSGWLALARITKTLADPAATAGQHPELAAAEPGTPGCQTPAGRAGKTQDPVPAAADPHRFVAAAARPAGQRCTRPAGRLPRSPLPGPAGRSEPSLDQALRQHPGALGGTTSIARRRPTASNWSSARWRSHWSSNWPAASNCRSPPSRSIMATTVRKVRRSCSSSASPPKTKPAR
ncbi:putative lipoprotein [Pseudomonas aeruginosa]|nr:putative lipoprotein [Pseudomonas aeruginosa]